MANGEFVFKCVGQFYSFPTTMEFRDKISLEIYI